MATSPPTQEAARLTYFKGRGLGEMIRFMLEETGTKYTERTLTRELFAELKVKGDLYWQQLPLLEIDGLKLVQSGAIVRYLARKHDMYGGTQVEAYECDVIADGLADLRKNFTSFDNYRSKKSDPEAFVKKIREQVLPRYLNALEEQLRSKNGGEKKGFVLGSKICFADVMLIEVLEHVEETIPGLLEKEYPLLSAFRVRMLERPSIKNFYQSGRRNPPLNDEYIAYVNEVLDR